MKKIKMTGRLAELFGTTFFLHVKTPREAVRALESQFRGFREQYGRGGYSVFDISGARELEPELTGAGDYLIAPRITGSGGKPPVGLGPLPGIRTPLTDMTLTPLIGSVKSAFADRDRPDQRPSFIFRGPTNVIEQGTPVPLVYGKMRTGSVVVSAGIISEEL